MQRKNTKARTQTTRTSHPPRRRTPSRRRPRRLLQHGIAISIAGVLSFMIVLVLMDRVVMPWVVRRGQEVEVPDLTGSPREQAQATLSGLGFRLVVDEQRSHPTLPEGAVLYQEPRGHTLTKKGRCIYVVLSAGRAKYEMIDVSGVSAREAMLRLKQAGFEVGSVVEEPSLIPKGVVIAQDPTPGQMVTKGTVVYLSVSTGEKKITVFVPNLVNLSLDEARGTLEGMGLLIGRITRTPSSELLPDTILEQSPLAGEEVEQGQPIDLRVSVPPNE